MPSSIPQAPRATETVLVVEDDDDVRRLVKDELQHYGYTVLEAANGGQALLFCERYSGPIHVLVTDVVMPHMDGYDVADRLRDVRPGMRTLFISGYAERLAGQRRPGRPGDAFLAKPFTPDALASRVREVLSCSAAA